MIRAGEGGSIFFEASVLHINLAAAGPRNPIRSSPWFNTAQRDTAAVPHILKRYVFADPGPFLQDEDKMSDCLLLLDGIQDLNLFVDELFISGSGATFSFLLLRATANSRLLSRTE